MVKGENKSLIWILYWDLKPSDLYTFTTFCQCRGTGTSKLNETEEGKTFGVHLVLEVDGRRSWVACVSPSPSLAIYSPNHHTYSMCISTVHYCCHRNVMHSVSYRPTQLNEVSRLICSGSFILILKGHCKYSMMEGSTERREERTTGRERKERLDPPFSSSSPLLLPSLLSSSSSLISVLSVGSWCESVAVIKYTNTVASYHTHVAVSPLSVCVRSRASSKALRFVGMLWQRKVLFEII